MMCHACMPITRDAVASLVLFVYVYTYMHLLCVCVPQCGVCVPQCGVCVCSCSCACVCVCVRVMSVPKICNNKPNTRTRRWRRNALLFGATVEHNSLE
jgi:hypothetical protein